MSIVSNPKTEYLTRDDMMRMFQISKASVYRLVEQRQIPFYKVGGLIRFDVKDVLAYLEQNRVEAIDNKLYDSKKN